MGDPGALAPRRRPRRSARRVVAAQALALAVGCVLLLWGADRVARLGAEALVARSVQVAAGTSERPVVHVTGRFFLPQVIRGVYDEVDVTTRDLTSGPLRLRRVDSRLAGVHVPFHDVLVQDVRAIGIARSVQQVHLTYDDLDRYLEATGRPLHVSPAPHGQVRVRGSVPVLGRRVDVDAEVALSVRGGRLVASPTRLLSGGQGLADISRALLRQRLGFTVPLQALPLGHDLTGVTATASGVRVSAEGRSVVVRP